MHNAIVNAEEFTLNLKEGLIRIPFEVDSDDFCQEIIQANEKARERRKWKKETRMNAYLTLNSLGIRCSGVTSAQFPLGNIFSCSRPVS